MTKRQAKKIVRNQIIRCRSRFDGPEDIVTGGCMEYPEATYRRALIKLQRRMNRETAAPGPGAIDRCTRIYLEMNKLRLNRLIQSGNSK